MGLRERLSCTNELSRVHIPTASFTRLWARPACPLHGVPADRPHPSGGITDCVHCGVSARPIPSPVSCPTCSFPGTAPRLLPRLPPQHAACTVPGLLADADRGPPRVSSGLSLRRSHRAGLPEPAQGCGTSRPALRQPFLPEVTACSALSTPSPCSRPRHSSLSTELTHLTGLQTLAICLNYWMGATVHSSEFEFPSSGAEP